MFYNNYSKYILLFETHSKFLFEDKEKKQEKIHYYNVRKYFLHSRLLYRQNYHK